MRGCAMSIISVIIPAYNCAETIGTTVNSILHCGLSDFEIILVDDGSEDDTPALCDELAAEHEVIFCFHQKNSGVSAARNRGLRKASGEYIWFFDADDSVDENALRRVAKILADDAPDMLIFGMSFDYYHKGKLYRRDELLPPMEGSLRTADCAGRLYMLYVSNALSSLCTRIIKKRVLIQAELFLREDMFLYEDLEFALRVWKQCNSVYFIQEAIYRYRQLENGGGRLKRVAHIPEVLSIIEEALAGEGDKDKILLSLYDTLAAGKIGVSSREEIKTVCRDYKVWIDEHGLLSSIEEEKRPMQIYKGQIFRILTGRFYGKVRHRTANWIKQNFGDFRKW